MSANAFAKRYPKGHPEHGIWHNWRLPNQDNFQGVDACLDSAGFVAMSRYGEYDFSVEDYFDLVESHGWSWFSQMDLCVEPAIADQVAIRLLRIAGTAQLYGRCAREAERRHIGQRPVPVLQGWQPEEYKLCAEVMPICDWPELVGIGSVCCRPLHGPNGLLAVVDAVDDFLPAHTKIHLFGVKGQALSYLKGHPRIESVDSQAFELAARHARRTGRSIGFRVEVMRDWIATQNARQKSGTPDLRKPSKSHNHKVGGDVLGTIYDEAAARAWFRLVVDGDADYEAALFSYRGDACLAQGVTAQFESLEDAAEELEEHFATLGRHLLDVDAGVPFDPWRHSA